ncbi:RES family NAD+ phosphorylase [Robertkochia sediminum]|uniref:RES family NAD+ phosphorylase n=1 Tax=Robertkochia sediminum TaxID=2785326 RepID=UPI00193350B8|nr:RES family NAD+ phosphorylase [Robertkochia sediminum]MBL7473770.1 RES family NAD+ phosphorylase [Robertkochia sediminum]
MIVYRITGKKHAADLSGTGAAIHGGRWNKKGSAVIYTGESKEIALLETIVHTPPMLVPDLDILTLEIPDQSITEISIHELPKNWIDYPAPSILAQIGEDWIRKGETIALKVPSCIIHSANNYILNCRHKDYDTVKLLDHRDFHFDSRLNS